MIRLSPGFKTWRSTVRWTRARRYRRRLGQRLVISETTLRRSQALQSPPSALASTSYQP